MRNKMGMFLVVVIILSSVASFGAVTFDWGTAFLLNDAGRGTFSDGWFVQMYRDVGNDTILSGIGAFNPADGTLYSGATPLNDTKVGGVSTTVAFNYFYESNLSASVADYYVYSVIFNSTDIASATQAIVVDSSTFQFTSQADGADIYTIDPPGGQIANNWVGVVPEPGTLALISVGAMVLGLRRRVSR